MKFFSILFLTTFLFTFDELILAQDYIFFTDSESNTYYDPSWLFVNPPSELLRVNTDKFPVSVDTFYAGRNALKLRWTSRSGGDWGSAIAAPGWPGRDITLKDSITFWAYSNNFLDSAALPVIYLEDLSNRKTTKVNLSDFNSDISAGVWKKLSVPIQVFINNPGQADLTKIKTIFLGQSISDSVQHTLFIDEVRMIGGNPSLYKYIVVLGSSTAAGTGANPIDSAWVNRFRYNLNLLDTSYKVINLAVGGYSTYDVMPSEFIPPAGRPSPKPFNNITYALEYNPKSIIVNLPTNDAAYNFPISETIANFDTLISIADRNNVPIWICSPQPRNFTNQTQMNLLFALLDSSFSRYNSLAIDFWNGLAQPNGYILPQYNSGDGIHLNNAGHRILYERASAEIFPTLVNVEEQLTDVFDDFYLNQNFPNPFNNQTKISFYIPEDNYLTLKIFNVLGQDIMTIENKFLIKGSYSYLIDGKDLTSGVYFYILNTGSYSLSKKMLVVK
uniref:T9SS type A sorting domain-containing protein n=1 Tax=Ignavibacterium album TaxID=591197 RepID=A0A7V2ZKP6_9BACT